MMSMRRRSWLIVLLLAVPYFALKELTGFEYPPSIRWIMIAFVFLLGSALLINPRGMLNPKPALGRALGAFLVIAASANAYLQLTQTFPE